LNFQINKDAFHEHVWPQIEAELKGGWTDCGPDTLALLLAVTNSKHVCTMFYNNLAKFDISSEILRYWLLLWKSEI
jgi:hypothetical protein